MGVLQCTKAPSVMAYQMYEGGRGIRPCTEPMGIPAGNWKLGPARFSETAEQIYCPARCKNTVDCHWSNTRREDLILELQELVLFIAQINYPYISVVWQRKQFTRNCGMYAGEEKYDRVFVGKREGKKLL